MAPREILVVEDDDPSRRLIRAALRNAGVAIREASSLTAAREQLAAARPDLILLDLRLRDGDGLSLVGELRAAGVPVPVVAVTAQALKGDRERALQAGCDHYLSKPISTRELRQVVERLLDADA